MSGDEHVKAVAVDDGKVEVTLNDKPVVLDGSKQTGESIKKAAIDQGVNIKQDFVLSIELGDGKTDLVGDHQFIEVHPNDRFLAKAVGIDDGKVEVTLNDKPVVLDGSKQTGESIKKAAIDQGVNIKQDFVLSIELGGGKTDLVGDDQFIEVHPNDRFLAIENDDNS